MYAEYAPCPKTCHHCHYTVYFFRYISSFRHTTQENTHSSRSYSNERGKYNVSGLTQCSLVEIYRRSKENMSWVDSIGIATCYRLNSKGIGVRVLAGSRFLSPLRRPDLFWAPPSLYPMPTRDPYPIIGVSTA
jgi:hypothetical protein